MGYGEDQSVTDKTIPKKKVQLNQSDYTVSMCRQLDSKQLTGETLQAGTNDPKLNNLTHTLTLGSVILFVAIAAFFFLRAEKEFRPQLARKNLFQFRLVRSAFLSKYFLFLVRLVPALIFLLVIATGLFGSVRGNLAAPFTWLFWWTLLIFFVAFAGKIFCMACPWDFFANLFQFGWFHKLPNKETNLKFKWPKSLSNIHLASLFFIIFTWFELVGVATNSYATALLGLSFFVAAVLMALVFKDRPFCRYLCPVGRISGIYAQFSPLEIRADDLSVCAECKTKECVKGTETSTSCPTGQIPFKMNENTFCTMCTECIRSCEKSNMVLKLRPPATDLLNEKKRAPDEIVLIILILVLTFFHGLTMTPSWFVWIKKFETVFDVGYTFAFTSLMPLVLLVSFFVFYLFSKAVGTFKGLFALIPLALGYHFGHNLMHFFGESLKLVSYLNDPFGWGWNVFGLKGFQAFPMVSHELAHISQYVCLAFGFYFSLKVIHARLKTRFLSHYFLTLGLSLLGLWLIAQPMVMRTINE